MGKMLSPGTLPARVTAAPLAMGWRGATGMNARGDGGIILLAKYQFVQQIPTLLTVLPASGRQVISGLADSCFCSSDACR